MKKKSTKIFWIMGLSGSGKSTLSVHFKRSLKDKNKKVIILDGDILRSGLNSDLGFSLEERKENIRRTAELTKIFSQEGYIVLVAMITPLAEYRSIIREIIGDQLSLIFLNTPLDICEKRDPKGLYQKARKGEIKNFTGISSPFEDELNPDYTFDTSKISVDKIIELLFEHDI